MSAASEHRNRVYTLIGVGLAMFLGALDQTIVSTAMPRIVSELEGLDRYTWTTTIYLLVSTLLVPVFGKLSDIYSRKTLELVSVWIFLIGSALCGLAGEFGPLPILGDGMNQLIVFRAIQGLGGAGIFSLAFIIVSDLYPPRERGKIGGLFGAVFGLSSVLGPVLGGLLTDHASGWIPGIEGWRWVFYVNVPIGIVALWFIMAKMPRLHPHDHSHKMNVLSAILMIAAFLPVTLALQLDKNAYPWDGAVVLGLFAVSAVLVAVWVWHSLKFEHPILELRLFKNKVFTTSTITSFFFGAAFMVTIVFLPLYMVNVQQVSATSAGVSVIPMSLGLVFGASLAGPIASKLGKYKGILIIGGIFSIIGAVLMALFLGLDTPYWVVILLMIVVGVGFGPSMSLLPLVIQNAVGPKEMGQATSSTQFFRQMGSVVGAAVLGAIFSVAVTANMKLNMPEGTSLNSHQSAGPTSKGPKEISDEFDASIAKLEKLFSARGDDARTLLAEIASDPAIPADYKSRLTTTPALAVEAQFSKLKTELDLALLSGNPAQLQTVLASLNQGGGAMMAGGAMSGNPGGAMMSGNAGGAMMSGGAMTGGAMSAGGSSETATPFNALELIKLMGAPKESREAAIPRINAGIDAFAEKTANDASAQVFEPLKKNMEETRDKLVTAIRVSFNDSIHNLWLISIFIMIATTIAIVFIPGLPLRGAGEHGPGAPKDGEGQTASPPMAH